LPALVLAGSKDVAEFWHGGNQCLRDATLDALLSLSFLQVGAFRAELEGVEPHVVALRGGSVHPVGEFHLFLRKELIE
jgi:hypothetical protein